LREQYDRFKKANTEILGISVDDVETQAKFRESLKLPFPLLADVDKEATKAYGVAMTFKDDCYSERSLFIVDKQGKIVYANPKFDLKPSNYEALYKAVDSLSGSKPEK
jgi:peroxiredoxin Q/BCP